MVRYSVGQSANPNHILQNRIRLDRELYSNEDEFFDVDVDVGPVEVSEIEQLMEEFGQESVLLAYHYFHRYRLWKMRVLHTIDLDNLDIIAFMLIEEEKGLFQAQENAKLRAEQDKMRT